MKRLRRDARILKAKSLASLRRSTEAFNSHHEDGRITAVLLHLQHAFEMLLKACLVERGESVFDQKQGRSIGVDKCISRNMQALPLSEDEAGLLRAIDALRDDEQHWYTETSEGILYAHCRAAVSLYDEILQRAFEDRLVNHLPTRVLPISSESPTDIQLLIDKEYTAIAELLRPGRRQRAEAQARIRALLAMEGHTAEDVRVSNRDVGRVERAIRSGLTRDKVFPRLGVLRTTVDGEGVTLKVHFTKAEGPAVTFDGGAGGDAAAIREVDLQKKYHWSATALREKVGIKSNQKAKLLRDLLDIDTDETCRHDFVFGGLRHVRYSDNAYTRMRDALAVTEMDTLWQDRKTFGFDETKEQLRKQLGDQDV